MSSLEDFRQITTGLLRYDVFSTYDQQWEGHVHRSKRVAYVLTECPSFVQCDILNNSLQIYEGYNSWNI
jgi:hypothetical protein